MLYCPCVLVAMETHFYVFTLKYQYIEKFFEGTLFKINFATTFRKYVKFNKISIPHDIRLPWKHFHVFSPKYQYFEKFFEGTLLKIKFATTFP